MAREKKQEQVKVNFNSDNAFLKEELQKLEEKYYGKDDIFGMTALTRVGYISGSRGIMTTGHLKQAMTPINPEFPKVFTEYENMVGKNSTGIKRSKREWRVIDKIYKFEEGNHLYTLIVKDESTGHYDIIQKKLVEDLTEKFGFRYNTEELDKLQNPYCQDIINGRLPLTIGGGIGQSRLCMFFLKKVHIGEVQSSIWSDQMIEDYAKKGIHLL